MRPYALLLILAVGVGALGYQEVSRRAEREIWRAETTRLNGELKRAEGFANDPMRTVANVEGHKRKIEEAAAELAELEGRILDAATELAMLESDRAVAKARAQSALGDLKNQIRSLTKIEIGMAGLGQRRHRLQNQVDMVEEQLRQAEMGAAARQKRAEALDRDIAGLAIRRETLQASLESVERTMVEKALAMEGMDAAASPPAVVASPPAVVAAAPAKVPAEASAPILASRPEPVIESADDDGQDRALGLYQFSSLSAEPEAGSPGQGGLPPSREQADEAGSTGWAEDQYLLGLNLLSTAEHSSGTRELNEAILAFKAVLGEWPKQRDPMRWAIARSDFGYALALLGKRQGSASTLDRAATACREALEMFERSETPLLWAAAQHHLGVSLDGLADMAGDQGLRQASIEALEQAIATFKNAGATTDAKKVEGRLREATAKLPAGSTEPTR